MKIDDFFADSRIQRTAIFVIALLGLGIIRPIDPEPWHLHVESEHIYATTVNDLAASGTATRTVTATLSGLTFDKHTDTWLSRRG